MDVTPLIPEGRQIIQSYKAGGFKIAGVFHQGPVIVQPLQTMSWYGVPFENEWILQSFEQIFPVASEFDVVLVGAGTKAIAIPSALRQILRSKGISPDVMDTGAACRTYNVLMAEGRRVMALLLPVQS
jgi:uncharacterized protein